MYGKNGLIVLGLVLGMYTARGGEPVNPEDLPAPLRAEVFGPPNLPRIDHVFQSLVKAPYVGVGVEEADATLRKQLKLPDGIGLAVKNVDENGPAGKAGLKVHDVLVKLKDQQLVNLQQFVTLVRLNKPGEPVEVSYYREGILQTLAITVGEKELPPLEAYARTGGTFSREFNNQMPGDAALNWLRRMQASPDLSAGNGMVQFQDEDHIISYSMMGDKPTFTVKGKDGKVIYEGDPKTAPDNIKALVDKYKVLEMARPNMIFFDHKLIEGPQPVINATPVTPVKPLAPPEKENF